MKHLILPFILIIALIYPFQNCSKQDNNLVEKAEIEAIAKTIDASIGWAKTKDLNLLYSLISNDSNYISVHPGNRVVRGFAEFKENVPFWMDPNFQYVRHDIDDLTINLSESGDAAWFYCHLNDMNTWKGQPANWENARWTGVLEKRDDCWVIVQQHFSFARE